jgi:hypothetical protein
VKCGIFTQNQNGPCPLLRDKWTFLTAVDFCSGSNYRYSAHSGFASGFGLDLKLGQVEKPKFYGKT